MDSAEKQPEDHQEDPVASDTGTDGQTNRRADVLTTLSAHSTLKMEAIYLPETSPVITTTQLIQH
jgi:hypothetical protein